MKGYHFREHEMRGSATGKLVDWASGEEMSKMTDQFGAADYSTFGALLVLRYGPSFKGLVCISRKCKKSK